MRERIRGLIQGPGEAKSLNLHNSPDFERRDFPLFVFTFVEGQNRIHGGMFTRDNGVPIHRLCRPGKPKTEHFDTDTFDFCTDTLKGILNIRGIFHASRMDIVDSNRRSQSKTIYFMCKNIFIKAGEAI